MTPYANFRTFTLVVTNVVFSYDCDDSVSLMEADSLLKVTIWCLLCSQYYDLAIPLLA